MDSVTGKELLNMLSRLWKEEGKTIIMVTHDLNLAKYARTIIELKDGQIIRISKNNSINKISKVNRIDDIDKISKIKTNRVNKK